MSIVATTPPIISSSSRPPRYGSSRTFAASMPHNPNHLGAESVRDAGDAKDLERLYWDNEDESFEVPDFHFDWGVAKEKATAGDLPEVSDNLRALSLSPALSHFSGMRTTPPSQPLASAQSSASSNHMLALTDASTASASSLEPTPPNAGFALKSRTVSSSELGSGGNLSNRPVGAYGGGRSFQRVVSAPIARAGYDDSAGKLDPDESILSASTSMITHTATIRPPLAHTLSGSSVYRESIRTTQRGQFLTPGLTDRTLATSVASTGRRIGGLSRFGGPARRVIVQADTEDEANQSGARHSSPVLVGSPPVLHAASPSSQILYHVQPESSSGPSTSPEGSQHRTLLMRAPIHGKYSPQPAIVEENESRPDHFRYQSDRTDGFAVEQSSRHATSPTLAEDKPFRPFQRPSDQKIHRDYADEGSALRLLRGEGSLGYERDDRDRPPPQPLRASHILPRPSSTPPPSKHSPPPANVLRPSRPPPPIEASRGDSRPEHLLLPQAPRVVPDASTHAVTLPAQAVQSAGKRSFLVNGFPYERLGILGKGGSSKVYSVLCANNRVLYALKRVALDRADAETYQSYTNEIELLKRLRGHDRIIQLIDHQITFGPGNRPKMLMMVMECGEIDFSMLLDDQKGRPMNMNFVGMYWEQMLEAVHAVHLENVVHTDLKPANFVLVKGRLKIIDFGIAKAVANDTVNIQRDQQIGTVNYMSPEAIQRMNNQKVLKLSYPSDVWSLGCILFQMVYGNPPFALIGGGPLPKMNAIANPSYRIDYPKRAVPKLTPNSEGQMIDPDSLAVTVTSTAIDCMKRCLEYKKEHRLTIPELLQHEFLRPKITAPAVPLGSTLITPEQMAMLVNFVLKANDLPPLQSHDTTADDLFTQLKAQNSLSS